MIMIQVENMRAVFDSSGTTWLKGGRYHAHGQMDGLRGEDNKILQFESEDDAEKFLEDNGIEYGKPLSYELFEYDTNMEDAYKLDS